MTPSSAPACATPFFLNTQDGERFCLYHAPEPGTACRGTFLYVHPFCDEMNKSRRMAALQARALAAMGFGVLQIDLLGCGDSSGDFGDACWERWHEDLHLAKRWLENRTDAPVNLWGARLGALLALDFAKKRGSGIGHIVLWQPVLSGTSFLNQFLRMRLVNEILASDHGQATGTLDMRDCLMAGESLEIAGYELPARLAMAIDGLKAAELGNTHCPTHWFEIVPAPGRSMTPATSKVVQAWRQAGVNLQVHLTPGAAFWATQEITDCPELIAALCSIYEPNQSATESMPRATALESATESNHNQHTSDTEQRPLSFPCHGSWLYGLISVPRNPGPKGVLIVVGGPQYRVGSHRQFTLLANDLAANGIAAMRFDYRGMGDSQGEARSFEYIEDDMRCAIDRFFQELPELKEVVIWGLCDAASAALFYAHQDRRVTGLVALNPWVRTEQGAAKAYLKHYYLTRLFARDFWRKLARGQFNWAMAMRSFARFIAQAWPGPGKSLALSPENSAPAHNGANLPQRVFAGLSRFQGKVLFILSGDDLTAQEFLEAARSCRQWRKLLQSPRVQRLDLKEANHTFSRRQWRDQVALWTRDWIRSW